MSQHEPKRTLRDDANLKAALLADPDLEALHTKLSALKGLDVSPDGKGDCVFKVYRRGFKGPKMGFIRAKTKFKGSYVDWFHQPPSCKEAFAGIVKGPDNQDGSQFSNETTVDEVVDTVKRFLESLKSLDGPAAYDLLAAAAQIEDAGHFTPSSLTDERERKLRAIVERRGQPDFRNKLIAAYGRCAVTGCDAEAALEAAHIVPYCGPDSNHIANGIVLRSDIHTLFDLCLIGINPDSLAISLAPEIANTVYREFDGKKLSVPANGPDVPNREALKQRWIQFSEHR